MGIDWLLFNETIKNIKHHFNEMYTQYRHTKAFASLENCVVSVKCENK